MADPDPSSLALPPYPEVPPAAQQGTSADVRSEKSREGLTAADGDGVDTQATLGPQALRLRRFFMAATATVVVMAILTLFLALGFMQPIGVAIVLTAQVAMLAGFFHLFRSGANLRFRDPSLAMPQMAGAIVALHIAMANASGAYEVLSMLYLLPFLFGTLRLNTREMVALAVFVLVGDLAVLYWNRGARLVGPNANIEWLRIGSLAFVLLWFAWIGGYLSSLRRRLRRTNEQLSEAVKTIRHMAAHDELTGVFNRRYLVETLQTERARADRYRGTFSVCLMDLDHFKDVNDRLGHAGGDVVLQTFARGVVKAKRPIDTFGRYGGEEFMLILPQTDAASAGAAMERMRELIAQFTFDELDPAFRMTVSIGVAEHRAGDDWQRTVERADEVLYRAKLSGRNRVEVATETTPAQAAKVMRLRPRDPLRQSAP